MTKHPIAYLGLLPVLPYIVAFYVALRMPHIVHGGFRLWVVGWVAFGVVAVFFAIARVRVVLSEVSGEHPFDWTRLLLVCIASCCLLIFVVCQRLTWPSHRTLWQDMSDDVRWLLSLVRRP